MFAATVMGEDVGFRNTPASLLVTGSSSSMHFKLFVLHLAIKHHL
jgi:hypothetical protein